MAETGIVAVSEQTLSHLAESWCLCCLQDHDIEFDGAEDSAHGYGSDQKQQQEQQQQQRHAKGLVELASDDGFTDAVAESGSSSSSGNDDHDGELGDTAAGIDELDEHRHRWGSR